MIFKHQAPALLTFKELAARKDSIQRCPNSENWIPARPHPFDDSFRARLRCAWLVFTGRADALLPVWQQETTGNLRQKPKAAMEGRHG